MKTEEQLRASLKELIDEYNDAMENRPESMLNNAYKMYLIDLHEDIMFVQEQLKQYEN